MGQPTGEALRRLAVMLNGLWEQKPAANKKGPTPSPRAGHLPLREGVNSQSGQSLAASSSRDTASAHKILSSIEIQCVTFGATSPVALKTGLLGSMGPLTNVSIRFGQLSES